VEVLVEGTSKKFSGETTGPMQLTGRTMTDHIVVFEGNERLIGQTVAVHVEEATAFTLFGTVVTGEQVGVQSESPLLSPPALACDGDADHTAGLNSAARPNLINLPLVGE
jgi:tRNA-2-methylthio-N6-dimethylallyladenosine synthase